MIERTTARPAVDGEPAPLEWHLGGVERSKRLRKPKGHPQPVWFNPF